MADYVANGPISGPIHLPDVDVDVDFNGVKFSYQIGLFFTPAEEPMPLKLPSFFGEGT